MLKKYKIGFDIWGALLFLIIMIPNFIWFVVPAPNDILRAESITETVDTVAFVCQILMIAALCIFRNKGSKKLCITPAIIIAAVCYLLYVASWTAYYNGMVNVIVIDSALSISFGAGTTNQIKLGIIRVQLLTMEKY